MKKNGSLSITRELSFDLFVHNFGINIAQNSSENVLVRIVVLQPGAQHVQNSVPHLRRRVSRGFLDLGRFGLFQAEAARRIPQMTLGNWDIFVEDLVNIAVGISEPGVGVRALEARREAALARDVVRHARQDAALALRIGTNRVAAQNAVAIARPFLHAGKSASAHSVGVDVSFARTGVFNPFEDVSDRNKIHVGESKKHVDKIVERLPAVRIDGKPSGMHEHGERRPVGDVMAEEVIHEKIERGFPGPVVVASIDHGADAGRNFLVVVVDHRHLPKAFVRILGTRSDLAFLGRFEVERVGPHRRVVLGSGETSVIHHAALAHGFEHKIAAGLQVRSAESLDVVGPNLTENLQDLFHPADLLHPSVDFRLLEGLGRFVSDGVVGDFVSRRVQLLRQPIIIPLVGHEESPADRTSVRVTPPLREQLFVEAVDVGIDAVVESKHDELGDILRLKSLWRLCSGAKAVGQLALPVHARFCRDLRVEGGGRFHGGVQGQVSRVVRIFISSAIGADQRERG